jgi:hypothetical protein
MLGPLPPLYRFAVCAAAFVVCVGIGAWLGFALPSHSTSGVALGAVLGLLVVALLLHHPEHQTRTERHRHRTH